MLAQLIAIKIYRERVLKQKIAATQQRVLALTEQHKKLLQQYQHIKLVWYKCYRWHSEWECTNTIYCDCGYI